MRQFQFIFLWSITSLAGSAFAESEKGHVSLIYNRPSLNISVDNQGSKVDNTVVPVKKIEITPLSSTNAGLNLSLGDYTIGYSQALKEKNMASPVQPEYRDYHLTYFGKRFGIDGSYSQFKHFRITGASGFDLNTLPESQLPRNIHLATAGVNFYAVLSDKTFSLDDYFDVSARQRKSVGGWMLINSLDWAELEAEGGLVPTELREDFGTDGALTQATFKAYNLQLGYAHVFSWHDFYLSGMLSIGMGRQLQTIKSPTGVTEGDGHVAKAGFRIAIGYSGKNWFSGYEIQAEGPTYQLETIRINTTRVNGQIFIGRHF